MAALVVLLTTCGYWWLSGRKQDVGFAQVESAMAQVKSAHFVGWRLDPETGERVGMIECWVEGAHKFRLDNGGQQIADDGTKLISIVTGNGAMSAVVQASGTLVGQPGITYLDLFTDPNGFRALMEEKGARFIGWESRTLPDGTKVAVAQIEVFTDKDELSFDVESKLLKQWEVFDLSGRRVQTLEKVEYGTEIPDSVFTLTPPAGAVVTDLEVPTSKDVMAKRQAMISILDQNPAG